MKGGRGISVMKTGEVEINRKSGDRERIADYYEGRDKEMPH